VLARLAARQHGVVARRQALAAGLTAKMLERRLESGRLLILHRGVYAVGHAQLRREGRWLAAVLAAGRGAVLSHRTAAALYGIRPLRSRVVDVSTPRQRRVDGVRAHRAMLPVEDVTTRDGIPVTTVARTLVDLAGIVARYDLGKAVTEAERIGLLDLAAIERVTASTARRRGAGTATMRAVLADLRAGRIQLTRSPLEDRFVALLDRYKLPRAHMNHMLGDIEVDACWPWHRLVVELDGYAFHNTTAAFQSDRVRDNDLVRLGYVVMRFTHADVVRRADDVAARLADALSRHRRYPPAP
jgi:very-short-patch-repair endonuclease